jgi:hypothetical protein
MCDNTSRVDEGRDVPSSWVVRASLSCRDLASAKHTNLLECGFFAACSTLELNERAPPRTNFEKAQHLKTEQPRKARIQCKLRLPFVWHTMKERILVNNTRLP